MNAFHSNSLNQSRRTWHRGLSFHTAWFLALGLMLGQAQAANYTVNLSNSAADATPGDGFCDTDAAAGNQNQCSLRAAISQANAVAGPHTIKFAAGVTKITLTASLPGISAPIVLDGTNAANVPSGGRVEVDGAAVFGCFTASDSSTGVNSNGASGTKISNFLIRRCNGDGISLSGNGYTIIGNRIGTNPAADSNSSGTDANTGAGISITGSVAPPAVPPTLTSLLSNLPQNYAGVAALQVALQSALAVTAGPNLITGNVISGNNGNGIFITGQGALNNVMIGNLIGLSHDGLSAIPNGRGGGGANTTSGIRISGNAYGNFIGPGNIISGNQGSGIALEPGAVLLPNFIAGNLIGLGSAPISVGNQVNGIQVDTNPKTTGAGANNPTGIAAIIGPANTISDNQSTAPSADLDVEGGDTAGGLLITGASKNVRAIANVIGLATFPAGSTPLGQLTYGNAGNGMVITTSNHEVRNNIILANGRHGIVLRGSGTANNIIKGNFIGVSVPTGLSSLVSLGNVGDGIHISGASSTIIGGTNDADANFIAANGRNGIALRGGASSNGWANLIQRNKIYGNARLTAGIEIDLEHPNNAPDGLDTLQNPGINYANLDQHRPVVCGSAGAPSFCNGLAGPRFTGSATEVRWSAYNRPSSNNTQRIEFFAYPPDGGAPIFLGEKTFSTDATGRSTGGACVAGVCTTVLAGSTNVTGMNLLASVTDVIPIDVPPTGDQPSVNPLSPANNTSEFSTPATIIRKLDIVTAPPLPSGTNGQNYSLAFSAIGGVPPYSNWTVSSGAAPTGLILNSSSGLLSGTASANGTFNFSVQVSDSTGATAVAAYGITIAALPPLSITTPSPLPNATSGTAYNLTFAASGGTGSPSNWLLNSGVLPNGLTLNPNTGLLNGTPTQVGDYSFTIQVSDSVPTIAIRAYTLKVNPAPVALSIGTASPLSVATQNSSYSASFTATGGSGIYPNWSISSGALPSGVSLNTATGTLSGTPTVAGAFNFNVSVTDSAAVTASKSFSLTVNAEPPMPTQPLFIASPSEIDFGDINIGRNATVDVTLTNLSTTAITPQPLTLNASSGFTTQVGTCGVSLAPQASCVMSVVFTPQQGGGKSYGTTAFVCRPPILFGNCPITLPGDALPGVLARIKLLGKGVGTMALHGPRRIDFGNQLVGTTSNAVAVTFQNRTDNRLNPSAVTFSNPGVFTVNSNSCLSNIDPGVTCSISFVFTPVVVGGTESTARISFSRTLSPPLITESYDVVMLGNGISVASPSTTTPTILDYGDVNIGSLKNINVGTRNTAGVQLAVNAASIGEADASAWSFTTGGNCAALPSNNTCTHGYRFSPKARGSFNLATDLNITGAAINQTTGLALLGRGVGSLLRVTPQNLNLGMIAVGKTTNGKITIANATATQNLDLSLTGATPFTVLSNTCPAALAPAQECEVTYQLAGTANTLGVQQTTVSIFAQNALAGLSEAVEVGLEARVVDALFGNGFE